MRLSPRERVKERDSAVPCRTCGRPTWSLAQQCVRCRWFGPPDPEEAEPQRYVGPFWGRWVERDVREPSRRHKALDDPIVPLSATGEILGEARCRACGYNLRGLQAGGICPECAAPIAPSLRPDRLSSADAGWLERLQAGALLLLIGLGAATFGPCLMLPLLSSASRPVVAGQVCSGVLLLAALIGSLLYTAAEPEPRYEPALVPRRVARWSLAAALLSVAGTPVSFSLYVPALVLAMIALPALLLHTRRLLLRADHPRWATQAAINAVGLPTALAGVLASVVASLAASRLAQQVMLLSAFLWLALPVFALWTLLVLFAVMVCLAQAADRARDRSERLGPS